MKNGSRVLFIVTINYLLIVIIYVETFHSERTNTVVPELTQLFMGNIVAGAGYSSDSEQVTSQSCYNASVSFTSRDEAYIELGAPISFSELESNLGIDVSISGKYEMFAADAKANYIRSLQDKDYAMSLNYYQYFSNNVAVQIADYGDKALTVFGKSVYNDGNNPYFGLECGDNYISSYQQGALLAMGLNIQLNSSFAKQEFNEKSRDAFGNIEHAATKISSFCNKYNIIGSITVQAFQMGGEPNQLSKILSYNSSGQYYELSCSLSDMKNCMKAANDLLKYAKDNFPKQFSLKNNIGLTPLGVGFIQYNPIKYIGLNSPVSLVTQEVKEYRQELSDLLKKNQYYQQKFYSLLNGYPVKLGATVLKMANIISSKAENNIRILMQQHNSSADCFNFPQNCKRIRDNIVTQLQDITANDLKFFDNMKYIFPIFHVGMLYNTGEDYQSWLGVSTNPYVNSVKVCDDHIFFRDTQCSLCVQITTRDYFQDMKFIGTSTDGGMKYVGIMCARKTGSNDWDPNHCSKQSLIRQLSPFFVIVRKRPKIM